MSKIEWTEKTWNPSTGCTKVSQGCKYCYAEKMHNRLHAIGAESYQKPFSQVGFIANHLQTPLKRKKPTVYFVNSMSDLFHDDLLGLGDHSKLDETIALMQGTMHAYQVLTKRPHNAKHYFKYKQQSEIPENLWLGVSVENKKEGIPRIEILRNIHVKHKFLSIEPLLEDLGEIDLTGIEWVIVGGESGGKARPMKPEWVESIRVQCEKSGVMFFFKQWGSWGEDGVKRNKKQNGHLLNGREYRESPDFLNFRGIV